MCVVDDYISDEGEIVEISLIDVGGVEDWI